MPQNKGHEKR